MRRPALSCRWVAYGFVAFGCGVAVNLAPAQHDERASRSGDRVDAAEPAPATEPLRARAGPTVAPVVAVAPSPASPSSPTLAPAEVSEPADRLAPPLRHATFAFSGDTLPHDPVIESARRHGGGAFDFSPMFARVAPIIEWAGLAICHLETPVAPEGEALSPAPRYGVPKEIAAGIASGGYDRCSTASNHSLDRGTAGIDATVTALHSVGLSQTGVSRSPEESSTPQVLDVAGVAVSHLSYTWSFNGFSLPAAQSWRANLIDPQRIVADGAEVVIVSLHWGNEGDSTVTSYQRRVAAEVTRSGLVDLIVGHHAHVVQPIEMVNARWVVFGMGNTLSNMPTGAVPGENTQDGIVVTVRIDEQADGSFRVDQPVVYPTWVDREHGHVIRPVLADLADPATPPGIRNQLQISLQRTTRVVGDYIFSR
jgi:poly-gamma-glutamate synthesis protein (capsule biosynthesis protein)